MTSSELIKLRDEYRTFKSRVTQMYGYCENALDKLEGSQQIMRDGYTLNGNSADNEYLNSAINSISTAYSDFRSVISTIDEKIQSLNRQIEIAKDKEMAKSIDRSSSRRTITVRTARKS